MNDGIDVRARDDRFRDTSMHPAGRLREDELHERAAMQVHGGDAQIAEEPGETAQRHQHPNAALVAVVRRDRPRDDQNAADEEVDD